MTGVVAGLLAIAGGWAASNRTPQAPPQESAVAGPAWVGQEADPRSCKPRPPFGIRSAIDAGGNWVVDVANPGQARDLVITTWSEVSPTPAIVWQGRFEANEARTFVVGAPPVAANRVWAAVELLPDASAPGSASGTSDDAPSILRSVTGLERAMPVGTAAAEPQPHVDPSTGERVLDLPGTIGTEP
jgi:hypothetical protein